MNLITSIIGKDILDSRGNPTVLAEVEVDKILTEQEIISNYKKREAAAVFEDISDAYIEEPKANKCP